MSAVRYPVMPDNKMPEVRCPVRPVLRLMDGCEWEGRGTNKHRPGGENFFPGVNFIP
jgi:hypothetical protein